MRNNYSIKYGAVLAMLICIVFLGARIGHSQNVDVPMNCDKDVCTMLFYYNQWDPQHIPVLEKYDSVVMNQVYQQLEHLGELPPTLKVLFYLPFHVASHYNDPVYGWAEINAHENWFLHNVPCNEPEIKDCRIFDTRWPQRFYMDMNNSEFVSFMIDKYLEVKNHYPTLQGFMLDGPTEWNQWNQYAIPNLSCSATDVCPAEIKEEQSYKDMNNGALPLLMSSVPETTFMVNSAFAQWDFPGPDDGELREDWVHLKSGNWNLFKWENGWKKDVDGLANPLNDNRLAVVLTGASFGSNSWTDQMLNYTLGSFLLGKRANSDAFFSFESGGVFNDQPQYYELYDQVKLGRVMEDYQTGYCSNPGDPIFPKCVYSRKFENGLVIVNPNFIAKSFPLVGRYKDLNGHIIRGSVYLAPHTAKILFKVKPATIKLDF